MNNINKHFCSYEISKELKELGFDEPCVACYFDSNSNNDLVFAIEDGGRDDDYYYNSKLDPNIHCIDCTTPLISQALEFLREKYGYHFIIKPYFDALDSTRDNLYSFDVIEKSTGKVVKSERLPYEQAQEAGISAAINLIKQKKQ